MKNFDEIEICFQHIALIITKMGEVKSMIEDDSEISNFFQSNQQMPEILDKVKIAIQTNDQLPDIKIPEKYKTLQNISTVHQNLQYFIRYLQLTQETLKQYQNTNNNENFRCDYLLTIRFCQLFVVYSKLAFFLSKNPICCQILLAFYAIDYQSLFDPKNQSPISLTDINFIIKTAIRYTYDLENCLHELFDSLKSYIESLFSEVSTTLTNILNRITRENFSIFFVNSIDSTTFPPIENIVMMNIDVIEDMVKIYYELYKDEVTSKFPDLLNAIQKDSTALYISSNCLIRCMQKDELALNSMQIHTKKITYLLYLLKEYYNYSQISINSVMDNYIKLICLINYSIHEITSYLDNFSINLKNKNSQILVPDSNVFDLITVIFDLIDLMKSKQEDIQRFYIYNLATVDRQYLQESLTLFNASNQNESDQVLSKIYKQFQLMLTSLGQINLDSYDQGEKYDFMPLKVNAGRLCVYSQNKYQYDYINSLFEHLNTILLHISFVENPFDIYCNFANLAEFSEIFAKCCSNDLQMSLNDFPMLLRLLKYLNKNDQISQIMKDKISKAYSDITFSLPYLFFKPIMTNLSVESPFITFATTPVPSSLKAAIEQKEQLTNAQFSTLVLDTERIRNQTRLMQQNYLMYDFYNRLRDKQVLLNTSENIKQVIDQKIIGDLSFYSYFPSSKYEVSIEQIKMVNSILAEYYWPLLTVCRFPFNRHIYNIRLNQSMYSDSNDLINWVFKDNIYEKTPGLKLFARYKSKLDSFLETDFISSLYQVTNYRFSQNDWLSAASLKSLFDDFGPNMAIQLDTVLLRHISLSIMLVYMNFANYYDSIGNYYLTFKENPSCEMDEAIKTIIKESIMPSFNVMIKLGAAVTIRRMVRSQLAKTFEDNIPGFIEALASVRQNSKDQLSSIRELVLFEMLGGSGAGCSNLFAGIDDEFFYVRQFIQKKNLTKSSDFLRFCFFIGLMMFSPEFDYLTYDPAYETMSSNVHLFPVGLAALFDCSQVLFSSFDKKSINPGMEIFFKNYTEIYIQRKFGYSLAQVLQTQNDPSKVMKPYSPSKENLKALKKFVDLFPKYIPSLEIERVQANTSQLI